MDLQLTDKFIDKCRSKLQDRYGENKFSKARKFIQNSILRIVVNKYSKSLYYQRNNRGIAQKSTEITWFLVLEGPIGCGKTTLLHWLLDGDYLTIEKPVIIDLDVIHDFFPESSTSPSKGTYQLYFEKSQEEIKYLIEMLCIISLSMKRNIILEASSLISNKWYEELVENMTNLFPYSFRSVLMHIKTNQEILYQRILTKYQDHSQEIIAMYLTFKKKQQNLQEKTNKINLQGNTMKEMIKFQNSFDNLILINNTFDDPIIEHPWFMKWEIFRILLSMPGYRWNSDIVNRLESESRNTATSSNALQFRGEVKIIDQSQSFVVLEDDITPTTTQSDAATITQTSIADDDSLQIIVPTLSPSVIQPPKLSDSLPIRSSGSKEKSLSTRKQRSFSWYISKDREISTLLPISLHSKLPSDLIFHDDLALIFHPPFGMKKRNSNLPCYLTRSSPYPLSIHSNQSRKNRIWEQWQRIESLRSQCILCTLDKCKRQNCSFSKVCSDSNLISPLVEDSFLTTNTSIDSMDTVDVDQPYRFNS